MVSRERIDRMKYKILLSKIRWFLETEDAMRTVRNLMFRGRTTLATYKELSQWAGKIESELRKEVEDGS